MAAGILVVLFFPLVVGPRTNLWYGFTERTTDHPEGIMPKNTEHAIRWYVYAGGYGQPLEKMRRTAQMRGQWPGWDAECKCGWASNTGGAIKSYVDSEVWSHKWDHNLHAFQQEDAPR